MLNFFIYIFYNLKGSILRLICDSFGFAGNPIQCDLSIWSESLFIQLNITYISFLTPESFLTNYSLNGFYFILTYLNLII